MAAPAWLAAKRQCYNTADYIGDKGCCKTYSSAHVCRLVEPHVATVLDCKLLVDAVGCSRSVGRFL